MRVVLLAPSVSVHTHNWYAALARQGVDVTVITSHPAGDGLMNETAIGSGRFGAARYFLSAGQVRRAIAAVDPDIVHAHYATGYGWWGARSRFHPYVLSVWGSDISSTFRQSVLARRVGQFNLRSADFICATSKHLADETSRLCPDVSSRISVVPFGIDTARFKPDESGNSEVAATEIGAAKVLERIYGLDTLLRSFRLVIDRRPDLRLSIAGDGPERVNLQLLARTLDLENRVRFLGMISHSEMPSFFKTLSLFVMPSRDEAYGVAALEAMSCGVPVIGSRVGGIPEVLDDGKCGILVPPDDPPALADAITRAVSEADLRSELAVLGRQRVLQRFSEEICVRKQLDVYESALRWRKS